MKLTLFAAASLAAFLMTMFVPPARAQDAHLAEGYIVYPPLASDYIRDGGAPVTVP